MKTNSIKFDELKKFNDSNSVVLIATVFKEGFDFSEVDEFLSEQLGFSKGKNLIGVHFIEGNVRGVEGLKDWLLEFDNEEVQFNPLARLKFPPLKWTSDFIDNYGNDYTDLDNAWPTDKAKYKVTVEKNGVKDFIMLYAESDVDAYQRCADVYEGTGYEIIKVEEA